MDKEDRRIPKRLLAKLKKEHPEYNDNEFSYGIIPPAPRPTDIVYRLDYSPNTRYLRLNTHVIKHFQLGKRNDEIFNKLFKQKGWVKKIKLTPPDRASQVIKVAGLPKSLSNAIFDSGDNGSLLVVHTVITRERASEFHVNYNEVKNYIVQMRDQHYSLVEADKRK